MCAPSLCLVLPLDSWHATRDAVITFMVNARVKFLRSIRNLCKSSLSGLSSLVYYPTTLCNPFPVRGSTFRIACTAGKNVGG